MGNTQPIPTGTRTLLFGQMPLEVQRRELDRLPNELSRERLWFADGEFPFYADKYSVLNSTENGDLAFVETDEDSPFRQYFQDRTSLDALVSLPDDKFSVPLLRPSALAMNWKLASAAKEDFVLSDAGQEYLSQNELQTIYFSMVSMLRIQPYQDRLNAQGTLSVGGDDVSRHLTGFSVDYDHSGFYAKRRTGEVVPVNGLDNPDLYTDLPIHALHRVLEVASANDQLAFIAELPDGRGCYHVTINPMAEVAGIADRQQLTTV